MTWEAQMVGPDIPSDSAPLLRGEFGLESGHGSVVLARLTLTAQGVVEAWLNDQKVSEDLLTPGWSSFEWRLRYVTYDVAHLLRDTNVLGIAVGRGWYGGRFGWAPEGSFYGNELGAFAQLEVIFEDGHRSTFSTDESWQWGQSAITANDLFDGQTIDARLLDDGWKRPGFSADGWRAVRPIDFDVAKLDEQESPPMRPFSTLPVRSIQMSPSGKTLLDFGQNLVGWLRVKVRGPEGTQVTIRHAEVLEHGELATGPLRSAEATDRFILSGGDDVFEPTFTLHGFRYAEVDGWPGEVQLGDIEAVAVGSELERIGTLTTSDELLNRFHENVVWGMRGNFVDLPTDCPQRDERLGWTGDISVFAPTAAFLFDVDAFLANWLVDLDLEQRARDGIVGWVVPDPMKYLPDNPHFGPVSSTAIWGDAAVWVPWTLYQAYGDEDVLRRQFPSMAAHMRHVKSLLSPTGVWDASFQFGDWLDPDAPADYPHLGKADPGVVATACAYRSADFTAQTAALLGLERARREFEQLASQLKAAFADNYVKDGLIQSDCQTVYALAIAFGILDPETEQAAGDRLVELVREAGHRISTGFAGTPFVNDALTKTGYVDDAYQLLMQRECPSWLYAVTMGATTVWERWDSMLPDGTINPSGMTSFNHYALGSIADWMHRVVGGISPLAPGYARVLVAPRPGGGLTHAESSLRTPHGDVRVRWEVVDDEFRVHAEMPAGVEAVLSLPGAEERVFTGAITSSTPHLADERRARSLEVAE